MLPFTWLNENFILHPSRCIYWEQEQALILSDLHLGKTGHFRKEGIAVPQQVYEQDLQRLFEMILFFKPKEVLMVGDLFHSKANKEWEWFAKWRHEFASTLFTLILGNHDKLPAGVAEQMEMNVFNNLTKNNILLVHNAEDTTPALSDVKGMICGHIHPAIQVPTGLRQSARLPCFHFSETTCTLPAFSLFTGNHVIRPRAKDHVFVIAEGKIIRI
jgi:DNA ligase-associated metallophosphoesterase